MERGQWENSYKRLSALITDKIQRQTPNLNSGHKHQPRWVRAEKQTIQSDAKCVPVPHSPTWSRDLVPELLQRPSNRVPCVEPFPPAPSLLLSFGLQSHVAGSTLTWAALAVLTGAFCSISTDLHHLHLSPFPRGKVGILYNANLTLTIPNSRVFPIMEPSHEYLPDHLFSTFTAPQPSQRPRDWGATVIVRKVRGRSSGCLCSPPPHPDLLVSTVATYGPVSALLLSPF